MLKATIRFVPERSSYMVFYYKDKTLHAFSGSTGEIKPDPHWYTNNTEPADDCEIREFQYRFETQLKTKIQHVKRLHC